MRVCLDEACGQPWYEVVARPAIRHAPDMVLANAIRVAEQILSHPDTLAAFNEASLRRRGKRSRAGAGVAVTATLPG